MVAKEVMAFVKVWQANSSIDQVVKATGKKKSEVQALSRSLRKKGVDLKLYGKSTTGLSAKEVEEINAVIKGGQLELPGV